MKRKLSVILASVLVLAMLNNVYALKTSTSSTGYWQFVEARIVQDYNFDYSGVKSHGLIRGVITGGANDTDVEYVMLTKEYSNGPELSYRAAFKWTPLPEIIIPNKNYDLTLEGAQIHNTSFPDGGRGRVTFQNNYFLDVKSIDSLFSSHSGYGAGEGLQAFQGTPINLEKDQIKGTTKSIDKFTGSYFLTDDTSWKFKYVGIRIKISDGGPLLKTWMYLYRWVDGTPPIVISDPVLTEPTVPERRFSDLSTKHWAYNTIIDMVDIGVLSGYPNGSFQPNNTVTRAEFSSIMVKALKLQSKSPNSPTFSDVPLNHWAYGVVESASGYMTGYRDTVTGQLTYKPNSVAVREDVAVAIVKARGLSNEQVDLSLLSQFSDLNQISPASRNDVAIAVKYGFMKGTNIGFEPQKALTRAEACELVSRIINED